MRNRHVVVVLAGIVCLLTLAASSSAQAPSKEVKAKLYRQRIELSNNVRMLTAKVARKSSRPATQRALADISICDKAAVYILKHNEFYQPKYVQFTEAAMQLGQTRIAEFNKNGSLDLLKPGYKTVLAYQSEVDESFQPYALSLPAKWNAKSSKRWPMYVVLHGRNGKLNEVSFVNQHEGKAVPKEQTWIQIDVFGRVNNAYRWGGEVDVFEAMKDAKRRVRVDDRRIALWGFSMGGAGAWHLAVHHPSQWVAAGGGAGFVDFYKYQKRKEQLSGVQHKLLSIYDADKYALNLANIPFVTYGGEKDPQLLASKIMKEQADLLDVPLKMIVGPNMGHKFDDKSKKEFMAFLAKHVEKGRPAFPGSKSIRFTTSTTKYNKCEWLTVEELVELYKPAVVDAEIDSQGVLRVTTENVRALQISRDIATDIQLDDNEVMPLSSAARGLLPGVFFVNDGQDWSQLNYDQSRLFEDNSDTHKRKDLQGPIDDAFMQSFVVIPPEKPDAAWSTTNHEWLTASLNRVKAEYSKWMRAQLPGRIAKNLDTTKFESKNLVLFGDPGSNPLIAKVVDDLPIEWTKDKLVVNGKSFDTANHGLCMIYPNPLNKARYVVINSGYTMREKDFKSSNSYLFPKLGDIAVVKFTKKKDGSFDEEVVLNELFNSDWEWPGEDE